MQAVPPHIINLTLSQSIENSTLHQTSVLYQSCASLHVWMSQVSTDGTRSDCRIRSPQQLFVIIRRELLSPFHDGLKRNYRRPFLDFEKVLSVFAAYIIIVMLIFNKSIELQCAKIHGTGTKVSMRYRYTSHHYREENMFGYVVRASTSKTKGKRNKAWTYARSRRSPFQHANA